VCRKALPIQDREEHARAMALLGCSHLSNNLNQIVHAVNIGVLPLAPETEAELFAALNNARELRLLLPLVLGLKTEDRP
jgi:hypothetical protein